MPHYPDRTRFRHTCTKPHFKIELIQYLHLFAFKMYSWRQPELNNKICLSKKDLKSVYNGSSINLKSEIQRALKNRGLLSLQNGLYVETSRYLDEPEKLKFHEFLASNMCCTSYISLEYALQKYQMLLFEGQPITSITMKNKRSISNFAGTYKYQKIKQSLYFGFKEMNFKDHKYYFATKAKALFDYLYLKPDLPVRNLKNLKKQLLEELNIQWLNFSEIDFKEFDEYVWKSGVKKMMSILSVINTYFEGKKFDRWAKNFLSG